MAFWKLQLTKEASSKSVPSNILLEKSTSFILAWRKVELLRVAYLREVGTLDLSGTVPGYVLKYEVVYRVLGSDLDVLVDDPHITLRRNLDYDRGKVLQLEQDELLLRNELVDEAVRRILTRLMTMAVKYPARIPASIRWLYFSDFFAIFCYLSCNSFRTPLLIGNCIPVYLLPV